MFGLSLSFSLAQKKQNELWFNKVIEYTNNGGYYLHPDANEVYTIKDGIFYGTKSGINKMKSVTTESFHNKLQVK